MSDQDLTRVSGSGDGGEDSSAAFEALEQLVGAPLGTTYSARQVRRAKELLTRLYAVRRSARFYPVEHPAVNDGMRLLKETIDAYHNEGVDVPLAFFEGELLLGETLLPEESILFDQLIRDMTAMGAGSIVFERGLDIPELTRAVSLLAADAYEVARSGGLARMAEHAGLPHIEIGEVKVFDRGDASETLTAEDGRQAYDSALDLMRELDGLVRANRKAGASRVKSVVRNLIDNVMVNRFAMLELSGLKSHDEYTFYHSANVAILSLALGSAITTDYRFLSSLGVGALLHDIGKLAVDLSILNKPGALTAEEWALVRHHPVLGAEHAALIPGLDKSAIVIILEHHMRHDLTGYPPRRPRRQQRLASRIVAIADAYDAMTSSRVYSAARVQDEAMALVAQSAGTALDPVLTRLFVSMMGVYPPRSVVRLSDGRTAIVLKPGHNDPLKPEVRVIADEAGVIIDPLTVDLADTQLTINRCIDGAGLNIEIDDYL
jgi:HD-GYP domain-containing protein (c-di-GMP phosphodiesterase class II)